MSEVKVTETIRALALTWDTAYAILTLECDMNTRQARGMLLEAEVDGSATRNLHHTFGNVVVTYQERWARGAFAVVVIEETS